MAETPGFSTPSALGMIPCEGSKTVKIALDFVSAATQLVDFSALQSKGEFSSVQAIFVDNFLNGSNIAVVINASYQTFIIPANKIMYLPVLAPNPPKFVFTSAGGVVVPVHFTNFFLPPMIWP